MNKTFTLSIPEPCHEDWNKMTPQAKGRFCGSCEKVVVDFTGKSDVTIANHLSDHKNVCGRFNVSQLNRPINLANRKYSLLPPMAASFILPLALLATSTAYSQDRPTATNFKSNNYVSLNIGSRTAKATKNIKGQVFENGLPLPGARVSVKGTNNQTQTDFDGQYRLDVQAGDIIEVSYLGFYSEQSAVNQTQDIYDFDLIFSMTSDEIVVVAQGIKREFKAMGYAVSKIETNKKVKGDTIQIQQDSIKSNLIRGTITTDYDGLALPGVNVVIEGTARGTQTDFDGNFEIEVKPGEVLVFSYVGFEHQKQTITKEKTPLKVVMSLSEELLQGEVVITGAVIYDYQNAGPTAIVPPKKIPKEQLQLRYKNATAIKKIQWEKKKQAKREARAARKKRK